MKFSVGILILHLVTLCLFVFPAETATAADRSFCVGPDDGTGTAELPPHGCAYLSPSEVFMIIDGLPPGTTIEFDPDTHAMRFLFDLVENSLLCFSVDRFTVAPFS